MFTTESHHEFIVPLRMSGSDFQYWRMVGLSLHANWFVLTVDLPDDGLCIGRDNADAVSSEYVAPSNFQGGTILGVGISVEKTQYLDLEKVAAAAFSAD